MTLFEALYDAEQIAGARLTLAAVDMPLSMDPITARQPADQMVSREHGAAGCSTRSPTNRSPGSLADACRRSLQMCGLPLATTLFEAGAAPAAIEVYPHVALSSLLGATYRVPYKCGRASRYWPGAPAPERRERLLGQWRTIERALARDISGCALPLASTTRAKEMKGIEDQLDAIVCAWLGTRYLEKRARAYGDERAAIWCPT